MSQRILQVPALIDIADQDKKQWQAIALAGTEFDGVFAIGDDFADARRRFAEVAATAIISGAVAVEGLDPTDLAAVRVIATTRKTFAVTDLDTGPTS